MRLYGQDQWRTSLLSTQALPTSPDTQPIAVRHPSTSQGPSRFLVVNSLLYAAAAGAFVGGVIAFAGQPVETTLTPVPGPVVSSPVQTTSKPTRSKPVRQLKPTQSPKPKSKHPKPTSSSPIAENQTCTNGNLPPACTSYASPSDSKPYPEQS